MADEYHWWGQDIQFSASGDDLLVSGVSELNQRIVRALLTNPGDYIWHPTYGAGLGRYVGAGALSPEKYTEIQALIRTAVLSERDVQKQPDPNITFQTNAAGLLSVEIIYTYAPTNKPQTLSFSPTPAT